MRGDNVEIMPYINSGKLMMKIELTGMLPTKAWSANVQTCVAAKVRYPYWKAVEGLQ